MIGNIKRWELLILVLLTVLFPFLATNYNTNLGVIYSIFTISAIVYVIADPVRDIVFKKESESFLTTLLISVVAVVAFILASTYLFIPGTKSLLHLLSSSTPVLANNPLTQKIVFGILVAISETLFFFVYGFDLVASIFNTKIDRANLKSFKLWAIIISISFMFMFFHLTAKLSGNLTDSGAVLSVVFFMAVFSMLLVVWRKQALEAVLFHIILNSLAIGLIAF